MKAIITANWKGNFREGNGHFVASHSSIGNSQFKHNKTEHDVNVTNPEELMAAAHAACYTMTLDYILSGAGIEVDFLETSCTITATNFDITNSDLILNAKIPNISEDDFYKFTEQAKAMCPVGKAYNLNVTLVVNLNK